MVIRKNPFIILTIMQVYIRNYTHLLRFSNFLLSALSLEKYDVSKKNVDHVLLRHIPSKSPHDKFFDN